MVNGMSVNGLGEVSMDTSATVNPNNLLAIGKVWFDSSVYHYMY